MVFLSKERLLIEMRLKPNSSGLLQRAFHFEKHAAINSFGLCKDDTENPLRKASYL